MTDNEKAATFIGWAPKTPCPPDITDVPLDDYLAAPDMTDPRNYMKALKAIGNEDYGFSFWCCEWDIWTLTISATTPFPNLDSDVVNVRGVSPADAAIKALACMYDSLHI